MKESELEDWLKQQNAILDAIIAKSAEEFYEHSLTIRSKDIFGFDLAQCQYECYNLMFKEDLCYDRPNAAFAYSLWYHGRRVNTLLSCFAKILFNTKDTQIEIFDLGAGTGAVQWAAGLVYHKMKLEKMQVPRIRIVNIDTSPFMLYYSRDFLWKHFISEYPSCKDFSDAIEYEINSWTNIPKVNITNPWIAASYLFDISDTFSENLTKSNNEYNQALKAGFDELINKFDPSVVFLLTANQLEKRKLFLEIKEKLLKDRFLCQEISEADLLLNGMLSNVNKLRNKLHETFKDHLLSLPGRRNEGYSLLNSCTWNEGSFIGAVLTKRQITFNLVDEGTPIKKESVQKIQLYNLPIKVRREIVLNDDQKNAAQLTDCQTIITGPAGCGKSVVLTERIKNLVEENKYKSDIKILVTTFNIDLLNYLGDWLEDILDKKKIIRKGNKFRFNKSYYPNIYLMNFDGLPLLIAGLNNKLLLNKDLNVIVKEAIEIIKQENKITDNKYDSILNSIYLLEEYHRIIYGLQCATMEDYLNCERKGRPLLPKNSEDRKLIWETSNKFIELIKKKKSDYIITKRQKLLQEIENGMTVTSTRFTHIFVDEFQDCTETDYKIFDLLVRNINNIVFAGDIAQAVHIGKVADVPRNKKGCMADRKIYYLKGSYRLPFRISESISNFSATIKNGNIISPVKIAPPGARPIIVYTTTYSELVIKIEAIFKSYKGYGLDKITILERDTYLCDALNKIEIFSETDTVLKVKGLEKTCILWATWKSFIHKQEVDEFVYTVITRTTGILIIALTNQSLATYYRIINLLRKDRIILWDTETKNNFDRLCEKNPGI
jgi:DNA helicase-2/ATP-dependent DNA helicase PcrA